MSEYRSPEESSWWPEDLPEEYREKLLDEMLEEEQGPLRVSIQKVEELIRQDERRYREVVESLDSLGIRLPFPVWDCHLHMFDMSACDERSAELASLMFEVGCIAANHARWDNELRKLRRVAGKGEAGTAKVQAQAEVGRLRTLTAFAELLKSDPDALGLSVSQLAERLANSLGGQGRGYSAHRIRTRLSELQKQVEGLASEANASGLSGNDRIRAIVRLGGNDPGITWDTARYFLHQPN